jgi:hypothetical protein
MLVTFGAARARMGARNLNAGEVCDGASSVWTRETPRVSRRPIHPDVGHYDYETRTTNDTHTSWSTYPRKEYSIISTMYTRKTKKKQRRRKNKS